MSRHRCTLLLATLAVAASACSGDDGGGATTPSSTTVAATPSTVPATLPSTEPPGERPATIEELLALGRPIVLAHTGGEDAYPGSTLFAFSESVDAGVDMLDLNVQLTADGVLVVQHDDTVDRTTNGSGAVAEMTFAEVNALDAAHWFTTDCGDCHDRPEGDYLYRGIRTGEVAPPAGHSADDFAIPSFEHLVERFPDLPLNIEIKGEGDPAKAAADELARLLVDLGREEASVVTSFDDSIVTYFHTLLPDVELSPGLDATTNWVLGRTPLPDGMRILQLPPDYNGIDVITPELVAASDAAGYPIWVWPNQRELENYDSYLAFLELGVVGLNINFPLDGVAAVEAFTEGQGTQGMSRGCTTTEPPSPGEQTVGLTAGGLTGTYLRNLPTGYDGATPLPTVIDLHGWGEPRDMHAYSTGFGALGEVNRFVTISPTLDRNVVRWQPWLASDDVAWLTALLDELDATLCIDTDRVFVAGFSNGAMMASVMACALSDRIAAIAPVAGVRDPEGCAPTRAVPVIAFHGTDDRVLAYDGGYGPDAVNLANPYGSEPLGERISEVGYSDMAVPDAMAAWAARNGCADDRSASIVGASTVVTWDCPADGATVLYTIEGGGHGWTTTGPATTQLIWEFFAAHPLVG